MNITRAHLSAILAFTCWGLFPLYWKIFLELPAWDLFGHRLSWSFVTLLIILAFTGKLALLRRIYSQPRQRLMLTISALLISSNWLLYIYAISIGRVLESSMGYFLNPLINVFMGWLILREKIRPGQWPAIVLACLAMVLLALQVELDRFPWLALLLSITFALYGLIRKLTPTGSLEGLSFETSVIIVPVLLYWYFLQPSSPLDAWHQLSGFEFAILSLSGVVTSLPLVLFAYSAKRLPLQTLGFIQYLSPSFKFICGIVVFKESLSAERLQTFFLIWLALGWYTAESYLQTRKKPAVTPPT
jgi:chloramphenicol-sensitive protein RarD